MQVVFKTTPHTRKFGVELEVSPTPHKNKIGLYLEDFELFYGTARTIRVTPGEKGWTDTHSNSYWHVKYDSTCGPKGKPHDSGWEIASFIGNTERDLEIISGAADWLSDHGVKTNNNCGYHIHIDVSDFTSHQMAILIARWLKIEFAVMSACPARRLNNLYCQFLNMRRITQSAVYSPNNLLSFWEKMAPQNLTNHDNPDKKYSVNTIGYRIGQISHPNYSRKTVEFRFPECLMKSSHVENWVRFLLCFVDDCSKAMPPEDIQKSESMTEVLQLAGLQSLSEFFLLDEKLYSTKIWFLQKIIAESPGTDYAKDAAELIAFIMKL